MILETDYQIRSHSNASYTVAVEQLWNIMDPEHVHWSKIGYCNRLICKLVFIADLRVEIIST